MAPLVDIAGLRYRYPETAVNALDGVDLALDGGLCAVAGPSGGGKSTLLRLLNGLVPHLHGGHIAGQASVGGHDVLRTPTRRLATTVGFVFQDAERQAVHSTVERDVAFGLENLGVPRREMHARVDAVLDRLGLASLRRRPIATLSGGERQRTALAGVLVLRPRLLVLDEPLSQLDAGGVRALLDICDELRRDGTTVVVAEHRLDDLLGAADALLTVTAGRCRGPAPPAALAAGLDSAPQIVRLSLRMGWDPVHLDPDRAPLDAARAPQWSSPVRRSVSSAWDLDGVATRRAALSDVTLGGGSGEVVALLGANGAGKTTLLRVIAGLERPLRGQARRQPGRVAYLPQNPAALLHRETVAAEIAWTAGSDPETSLLDGFRLREIAERDPRDLSSGQRQRVAIAAVLAGSPRLALLDEPTRGMDGQARDGLIAAVRRLTERGSAVVIATHDAELAALVADRVVVVAGGTARDAGDPSAALSGRHPLATQLGGRFASPGPVTVADVAAILRGVAAAS